MKNPTFGKWSRDDDPQDVSYMVEDEWLNKRGFAPCMWDIRGNNQRKAVPCSVTVGGFTIKDVVFPKKKKTCKQVQDLAQTAVNVQGKKPSPYDYDPPAYFKRQRHLIPLFRYYLAKIIGNTA